MKKIVLIGLLVVAIMFLGIGCASYNPRTGIPDVKTFQETGIKAVNAEAGITIIAYPIQTKEDADMYFDNTSLAKDGLLPVYVNVSVSDIGINKNYRVDSILLRVENRNISTIPADEAYKLIKKSWFGKSSFWWFFGAYIGAPISAIHTNSVNNKIKEDLEKKVAKEGEIKKEGVSGFLYFRIPDDLKSLDDSFLVFALADKDSKNLTVKLPLKGAITAK